MASPSPLRPGPPDLRQHLAVETPEHVLLELEIAGLGSRALAAILDALLLGAWLVGLSLVTALAVGLARSGLLIALYIVLSSASVAGYFILFEGLRHGQTPGKRRLGIRVVRDTGHPITLGAAVVRTLLRLADFLPPPYLTGALLVALHPKAKRLGDLVAGTVVIRDRPQESPTPSLAEAGRAVLAGRPLSDDAWQLLSQFHDRLPALHGPVRDRLAGQLAARFAPQFPIRPANDFAFLRELHQSELNRRRGVRVIPAGGAAHVMAQKQDRWREFEVLAERAASRGLDSFSAEELPDFAARYREVAADLARSRTYGLPEKDRGRLERLVAAGHSALYRDERQSGRRIWDALLRQCPAAVLEARGYVLVAFLCFAVPGTAGYLVVRERPDLAETMLPDVLLQRAEAGTARVARGEKYYQASEEARPVVATSIISNNIRVAVACFAGGAFFGVGSLAALAFNGVSIGATAGHFANVGLLGYLLEFIVGHGVLELFAIWVAGAAGLLLGLALVAPGDRRRIDALTIRGRLALRLVGASAVLLVIAGLIEGFLSAGEQDAVFRLSVSAGSLLFLVLYLLNGVAVPRARGPGV